MKSDRSKLPFLRRSFKINNETREVLKINTLWNKLGRVGVLRSVFGKEFVRVELNAILSQET